MKLGDLVEVTDEGSSLFGCQGEIVGVGDEQETLKVLFGPEAEYCFTPRRFEGNYDQELLPEQLRVIERLRPEVVAERMFPNRYHHVIEYQFGEGVEHVCMIDGCSEPDTHDMYVNYVGTVMCIRTCERCHGEWNGCLTETIKLG